MPRNCRTCWNACRLQPSDGRHAHRRLGAGLRAAREGRPQHPGARDIADRLMANLGSALLYWYHYSTTAASSTSRPTTTASAALLLHLLHGAKPSGRLRAYAHLADPVRRARVHRLDLHRPRHPAARARTCIRPSPAPSALRGPKHGGANEVAFEVQKRYETPGSRADIRWRVENKEVIIGFWPPGLHLRFRPAQQ